MLNNFALIDVLLKQFSNLVCTSRSWNCWITIYCQETRGSFYYSEFSEFFESCRAWARWISPCPMKFQRFTIAEHCGCCEIFHKWRSDENVAPPCVW